MRHQVTMRPELGSYRPPKSQDWCNFKIVHLGSEVTWKWYTWDQVGADDTSQLPIQETPCQPPLLLSSHRCLHRCGALRLADGVGEESTPFHGCVDLYIGTRWKRTAATIHGWP